MGFPGGASGKESACQWGDRFDPWAGTILWSRKWQPVPVSLPEKFHGQRSLAGKQFMGSQRVRCNWATEHISIVYTRQTHLSIHLLPFPTWYPYIWSVWQEEEIRTHPGTPGERPYKDTAIRYPSVPKDGEGGQGKPNLLTPWSQTCSFQHYKKVNFHSLSHCGTFFWKP